MPDDGVICRSLQMARITIPSKMPSTTLLGAKRERYVDIKRVIPFDPAARSRRLPGD
jgi:hypothetical protein